MAFFNVSSLGGNPFHTQVGRSIEQATDGSLASENWALNMEICDLINESSDTARDAMKAIRKRLSQNAGKNSQVIMYTLTVLETCVKNCGKAFHVLVAQKDFINELVKLIGPKNEPPLPMQEKVLSLIQIWADAFKNQPDLGGVGQVYAELKNKGIEFPQTDLDTMAPIYTPQRSVPEVQPQMVAAQQIMVSPQQISVGVQNNGPAALTPEQTTKLQSELEIVAHNMAVLGEMLSELKPGQEEPEDYQLLQELTATCKEMQLRIMELIGRINDDELTAECLRLNDELNNLFLRHQRYEKNRSSSAATSPSAILGAAMGVPGVTGTSVAQQQSAPNTAAGAAKVASAVSTTPKEPLLIDLASTDKLANNFSGMGIVGATHKDAGAADEFDMLAQSRTTEQNGGGARGNDLLRDIPSVEAAAGSIGSPYKRNADSQMSVPARQSELDEMEAWLGSAKEIEGMEETLTSTEFDKFLEERAAAADQLPTINTTTSASGASSSSAAASATATLDSQQQQSKKTSKKPVGDDNLLAL